MGRFSEITELDRAVDRLLAGTLDPPAEIAGLVGVAAELREAMADPGAAGVVPLAPERRRRRTAAIAALAAALALTLLTGTAFAASSGSAPGRPLYSVKRAFERLALQMRASEHGRQAFAWTLAKRRLAELTAVAGTTAEDEARAAYEEALARAAGSLGRGDDAELLGQIEDDLGRHVAVLNGLLETTPLEARAGLERAIERASQAKERVHSGRSEPASGRSKGGKSGRSR